MQILTDDQVSDIKEKIINSTASGKEIKAYFSHVDSLDAQIEELKCDSGNLSDEVSNLEDEIDDLKDNINDVSHTRIFLETLAHRLGQRTEVTLTYDEFQHLAYGGGVFNGIYKEHLDRMNAPKPVLAA